MKQFRNNVIRAGLEALYFTGAHHLLRPIFSGVGAIFMLHHVRPAATPNSSPIVISRSRRSSCARCCRIFARRDIDIITIDEMHQRLIERNFSRRFACFTLDDGYRDNRDFALPVMREFDAPFTVYVASDFAEGTGRLWWIALEMVIARASSIEAEIGDVATRLDTSTPAAKQAAFDRLHDWLRALPGEHDVRREIAALCARHGVDETAICRDLCMSWDELKPFAGDPLVTIGAHTITHCNLAKQTEEIASQRDGDQPRADRRARCSVPSLHLAYPYGDRDRRRRPRIRAGARGRIQDRGDDAAGHDLSRKRRPSDRAAAGLAQRQLSGHAHPAGADLRRRHRDVERLSPRRRGVSFFVSGRHRGPA